VRTHQEVKGLRTKTLELMEDVIVRLGQDGSRFLSFEIRLIRAKSQVSGEVLTFLTNIYGVSAIEIYDLYKKRWSIEVFFKFIKQELNANWYSKNTIMVHIASILLTEYRKCSGMESYKFVRRAFMNELRLEILKPVIEYCGRQNLRLLPFFFSIINVRTAVCVTLESKGV
jgi:hypothetical protein